MTKIVKRGIIDPSDIAFNGEEVKTLNDTVFEDVFKKEALTAIHTVLGVVRPTIFSNSNLFRCIA